MLGGHYAGNNKSFPDFGQEAKMRKRKIYYEQKRIKHFTAKFLITLAVGMACGALPIIFIGGDAIIVAMGAGLSGASFCVLVFGLV